MKLIICAGPPVCGKTTVLRCLTKMLLERGHKCAYLKIDVQYTEEDKIFEREFGIPVKKVYSGDLCPDHCNVMVLGDAIEWAENKRADILLTESAGLCFRCSPYIEGSLGMVVLEATGGMHLPFKIGPMLSLSDIAVITKIDLVSQAEKEVFRARISKAAGRVRIIESDALHGIGLDHLGQIVEEQPDIEPPLLLRGNPPIGTCTICVGRKDVGWKSHFGVVRPLASDNLFYRGE
ncbi:MAG: cobalamin biosynthesis protein [Thermoplasmata archaeon HGW-Thermoplasmata-1]|nr:MAG: cobalamin biosynthesis protein [Thermoplasmata archaeon HGW-Thermoplasmata-1]